MHPVHASRSRYLAFLLVLVATGCGLRGGSPPEPGYDRGVVPALNGERVLVLPAQIVETGLADFESELLYALRGAGSRVEWVDPEALRERMRRSPELRFTLERLDVQAFLGGGVDRVGDPLFGNLYQLGTIENAPFALLPVRVRRSMASDSVQVEVMASLIRVRTGRVLWSGVLTGTPGSPDSPGPIASAAEALARRIVPQLNDRPAPRGSPWSPYR